MTVVTLLFCLTMGALVAGMAWGAQPARVPVRVRTKR